ncbi:MAG: bifunctional UDP-N-acetylglucosamine diphosphorylase/glucosamine-1-phosphate N-acetyltransferase GlmU [Gammaproteobacteria bacterium]|jgi:bifunctional UDP-N-acetylglucosamine pyrophosphorylase/glucosamine-1-phosphate N-acetyltransferase|nr:bifunctional UDP-N-acetylglucosamine diphosphorylase/glucosamine-1-phosphate N-acetyltransferase GlmU [Gammaproteobacteria bacterium]MDH3886951.1 bifunctional UDP-N-acetylglucosamine diphosphorylase/glucosamine-1-phosphate N-acetyltransferase GlmU [Gammaproteobacteria bacterium]MDH3971048.1 bifunctional UDP-N-acetylglucosamine diphosphorylase/glucosamine-1-phosphate N-acetyltransferase GlmU [Gammaproteobacteria bacterium]MDH3985670.1 bifunctional UDP-N-acetylglucosamine diphosphorylase/glucos
MNLSIIILAAGQGTRMCSARPKVLHPLAGRPLLAHVIDTARELQPDDIHVVIGHGAEQVQRDFEDTDIQWALQAEQLGTGHAVAQAMPAIPDGNCVLVMYGDVPLVSRATLEPLCSLAEQGMAALLTAELDDPDGYGRILHHADGSICGIVEQKDASASERALNEINTGFVAAPAARLRGWVAALDNNNAQGEFYLTDVIARAVAEGTSVRGVMADDITEVLGINDRKQLAVQERCYQQRQAERCLQAGVTLADPARFDLRGTLTAGEDVLIDVNAVLEGNIVLGNRVSIGPNVVMRNATVGDDVTILANCVIEDAEIGSRSRIGPFARLRPETRLSTNTHIGNFVEIKKSDVGEGSKVNHLSYIGDTSIGTDVNIGAGTITCNYDGANKHRTIIGDRVFIGSDTQLVAPVEVREGATIGAGSTITRDVEANELALSRAPQETRTGWKRPVKKTKGSTPSR